MSIREGVRETLIEAEKAIGYDRKTKTWIDGKPKNYTLGQALAILEAKKKEVSNE